MEDASMKGRIWATSMSEKNAFLAKKGRKGTERKRSFQELEGLLHVWAYEAVVREEYERAKEAFEARKAQLPDRVQSSDLEGG